jgi:putative transposase
MSSGSCEEPGTKAPNRVLSTMRSSGFTSNWIADFTYVWTAEGWLSVTIVIDLFSRRVVGWSMSAEMDSPTQSCQTSSR